MPYGMAQGVVYLHYYEYDMKTVTSFDIAKLTSTLDTYFAAQGNVVLAYLFGSHARGQAGPLSDIDVAVLLTPDVLAENLFDERLRIMGDLMDLLNHNEVDVAILNQAPLALAYRVLRDGVLLYCASQDVRVHYTARIVSLYLDFKPVIERHERAILDRARQGKLLDGHNPYRGALERHRQRRQRLKGAPSSGV
jgi:uncharacterized protein